MPRTTQSGGGKYSAANVPGNQVLLRNEQTKLINIAFRPHTYSYLNVCCIDDQTARSFMSMVKNSIATNTLKTKNGKRLFSVDSRNPQLHQYWMDFMDSKFAEGISKDDKVEGIK